ncbi:MAG: dehydrogenase, partial [Luteitalea sp.]|nr:dehydrogenase [Luteitalea sp.]
MPFHMATVLLPLLLLVATFQKASMIPASEALAPEAALASFEVADGLQIELVASEPLVFSPVAMAFDERDRLFVVEMPGYPLGNPPGKKPADRVALLEDSDGDGRMDQRTVYADGLAYPTGVLPWKDGIIVTCAPDILFLRDTDGDGRADQRR